VRTSSDKNGIRLRWLALTLFLAVALVLAWTWHDDSPTTLPSVQADRVLVQKQAHTLTLFRDGRPLKTFRVALGRGGSGQKVRGGDNKVPEGMYRIVGRNSHSAFHRALRVGYPTPEQIRQAQARGFDPGGDIMIHGIRNGLGWIGRLQREVDWTKGCISVTDPEIEEIWRLVPDGMPIEIRP
jgi:murein L,D-transpeptidase YafK